MYFGAMALPSTKPPIAPPTPRIPFAPMIVVGEVLRIPAAISFFDTASTETRGLMRTTSCEAFATKGSNARSRKRGSSLPVTVRRRP